MEMMTVNGREFAVKKLLGKGKCVVATSTNYQRYSASNLLLEETDYITLLFL